MNRDEQAIRELVATWIEATKAGDVENVLSLMAEDVVFLVPGQPVMHKTGFAAAARAQAGAGSPKIDAISEIQEIKILGDWAFMWSKLTVIVTMPNQTESMKRAGHTLTIFQKLSDQWMLARDANLLTNTNTGS